MPDSLSIDVDRARKHLEKCFMKADTDWLQGCVEFFRNESGQRNYSVDELNNMVRDQWMLCDLREMCPGSLPPKLAEQITTIVSGNHVLQMDYLVNVAAPAYQQIQKLKKIDTTNIEVTTKENDTTKNASTNRMLKLYFTDGVQAISGLEYRPMRNLSCNLIPGVKILIKGPVQCRRGALLLEEKNVTVLGGEVDSMLEVNCLENVLARTVGLTDINERHIVPPVLEFTREAHNPAPNVQSFNNPQAIEDLQGMQDLNDDDFADDDEIDIDEIAALENQLLSNVNTDTGENYSNRRQIMKPTKNPDPPPDIVTNPRIMSNLEWSPPPDTEPFSNVNKDAMDVDDDDVFPIQDDSQFVSVRQNISNKTNRDISYGNATNLQNSNSNRITPTATKTTTPKTNQNLTNIPTSSNRKVDNKITSYITKPNSNVDSKRTPGETNYFKKNPEMNTIANPSKKVKIGNEDFTRANVKNTNVPMDEFSADDFTDSFNDPMVLEPQPSTSYSTNHSGLTLQNVTRKPNIVGCEVNDDEEDKARPLITINRLMKIPEYGRSSRIFTIKSRIKTLLGKLQRTKECWILRCTLDDGTGLLDVELSNDILCNMIGYSVAEISVMKKELNVKPDHKQKVLKGLERTQERLQKMHAFMDISFSGSNPRVVHIRE